MSFGVLTDTTVSAAYAEATSRGMSFGVLTDTTVSAGLII